MPSTPRISLWTLTLVSVSAIISLRNFPLMAVQGWSSVFFYLLSAILFFIPAALASAELAATWPKKGGIYSWVSEAFGSKTGLLAVWLEWIESVVWLPAVLAFAAGLTAYVINPALADQPYFLLAATLCILWSLTFLNYLSIQTSARASAMGVLFGTLFPACLIIGLAGFWIISGHPTEIPLSPTNLIPDLSMDNLTFFTGVLLGLGGIEVAAYHIQSVENPQRDFPRATFLSAFIILLISTLGSLAIALVVPAETITYTTGTMQAFQAFFEALGTPLLTKGIALLALVGALALLNTWIIGPSKGLLASAEHGDIPALLRRTNRFGSPVPILIAQASIASILSLAFILMPSVNDSYWLLTVMAAQLILAMYLLMFLAVIRLRYTQPDTHRPYKIPGGKRGVWIVAGTGSLACLLTIFVGLVPPKEMGIENPTLYAIGLICGIFLFSIPPMLWQRKA